MSRQAKGVRKNKMALFDNLFSKRTPGAGSEQETGPGHTDSFPHSILPMDSHATDRKSLRLERRELLYAVVRESMTRVGLLSSSYKYKVLSLDPRGRQYLIMMDLPQELATETSRLAEIESAIAQNAKARHDIVVAAVYWRINEPAASGLSHQPKAAVAGDASQISQAAQAAGVQAANLNRPMPPGGPASRVEPSLEDEVTAFRQARVSAGTSDAPAPSAKLVKSWRRNPAGQADFADTELQEPAGNNASPSRPGDVHDPVAVDSVEKNAPLSGTQYGDLN